MDKNTPPFDTLIRAGHLLSMDPQRSFWEKDMAVGINQSKISYVGEYREEMKAKQVIDARDSIVLPGFINGHGHLPMSLFRGLADDLPFEQWLHDYIIPLEARLVSPELVKLGTEISAYESIRFGSTTVMDMYFYEEAIAETIEASGLRALLGESIMDYPAPDNKELNGSDFETVRRMAERYRGHAKIENIICPHAPYSCSDATLEKVAQIAYELAIKVSIHVSETQHEVQESIKNFGKTPYQRLHDIGFTKCKPIMAHCVHLNDEEIALAKKDGASIVYNPESNMKLGSGAAPIPKFHQAGIPVGIGTDGSASNNNLNMIMEMNAAAKLQKLAQSDNTALNAEKTLKMATSEGARALGIDDKVGQLKVGMEADVICINTDLPHMQPLHNPASQIVYAATGLEVQHVFCGGQQLLSKGEWTGNSVKDLNARVQRFREKNNF